MREVYYNSMTGEPYYVSPDGEVDEADEKATPAARKSPFPFERIVLAGAFLLGSIIGTMIGAMICALIG